MLTNIVCIFTLSQPLKIKILNFSWTSIYIRRNNIIRVQLLSWIEISNTQDISTISVLYI